MRCCKVRRNGVIDLKRVPRGETRAVRSGPCPCPSGSGSSGSSWVPGPTAPECGRHSELGRSCSFGLRTLESSAPGTGSRVHVARTVKKRLGYRGNVIGHDAKTRPRALGRVVRTGRAAEAARAGPLRRARNVGKRRRAERLTLRHCSTLAGGS